LKKSILIISEAGGDLTTENVYDWLLKLNCSVVRLNGDSFENGNADIFYEPFDSNSIEINGEVVSLHYDSIWFRRWSNQHPLKVPVNKNSFTLNFSLAQSIEKFTSTENRAFAAFFLSRLSAKKIVSSIHQVGTNKLYNLSLAKKNGFNVPSYIVTTEKAELLRFTKKCKDGVITKAMDRSFYCHGEKSSLVLFTSLVTESVLKQTNSHFPLSFFQEYIVKDFEIRSFIFYGSIYSMAIFSQRDDRTKIDFRHYNFKEPNRMVPFKLPLNIESKILTFMSDLRLDTGSIDLIRTIDGDYVFLEINPVGQFSVVSETCNYDLEKKIAEYLSI